MNKEPLVSVIMNCYNSDTYLEEAIKSVYAQTYTNWEIIFWDNNSTDNSASIANSFDEKLKYTKADKTVPLYEARNLALDKCSGDVIAFLDCDDVWVDSKLTLQVGLYNSGDKFIYGGYDNIDGNGNIIKGGSNELFSGDIANRLFKRNPISIGCVLICKKLLLDNRFDSYYDLLGDFDLWIRLSINSNVGIVDAIVEHSRQHDNNTSDRLVDKWLIERRYFYKKYLTFINLFKYPNLIYYIVKTEIRGLFGIR